MRSLLGPLALTLTTSCAVPAFDLQPRYGQLDLSGSAGFSSGGVGGSADLEDAGLEDDTPVGARAGLKFGMPHLVALYQGPSFEGTGTLDATVSDGSNTITAGTTVDSEVSLEQLEGALVFDFVPGDTVEAGLGLGVAFLDLEMTFEDTAGGATVETSESLPIPLVAGMASVWIGPVQVAGFVGGIAYDYDDDSISYVDADLYARWKLFGGHELLRASLVVGYRLTDLDVEYDDSASQVDADLSMTGPYFGLEFSL